ncbi:TRAP transporter substrate-binding protein DctP [Xanthobacter sp. DSM 24535]|uniref:TRAP transporter substrate-binding protein n=1 Tax=Roseixanthobacter psychrophilus TaxID=3119917 RepID=UPI00372B3A07
MNIPTRATRRVRLFRRSAIAIVLATLGVSASAQAQKLRVADSFPVGHYVAKYTIKYWMSEVARLSNQTVEFEYYPAEQLGKAKDMLSLAQTGVADITYVAPAYISDKLPLSAVVELPFDFSSSCVGTKAYWKMASEGGILANRELGPLGVRVLFALMLPPNQLVLAKAKFDGMQSLEGMKIRTAGGAKELMLRKLKAVPIQVAAPELHEAMSRGTIDGMLIPLSSMPPYELEKLSKIATSSENFGSFIISYVISEARWKTLPPNVQKAMIDAGRETTERACRLVEEDDIQVMEKLKAAGMSLINLSPADKQTVSAVSRAVGSDWAGALDKRGKPGTEVLRAFEEALK